VDKEALRRLLEAVSQGREGVEEALAHLKRLPFENLGFARVDHHRGLRAGGSEAVFCQGKTPAQVVAIMERLATEHRNVLATRADAATAAAIEAAGLPYVYHAGPRLLVVRPEPSEGLGLILVVAAGTVDLPVAEEAALVAEALGNRVERFYDCGVAGLHRLLDTYDRLAEANVIIAVAGMDGAMPSVIAGLVDRPVIAVPTSAGYGAALSGLTPLLAMLTACAPGLSVVNIDNGYGAAHQASQINHLIARAK